MPETGSIEWEFAGQYFELFPQRALFWKEERTLIVADVHFGKVGHFRKAGIAIPRSLEQEDLATLSDLITRLNPLLLIFLGDLFHSELNNDWHWFKLWKELFSTLEIILVKGNHDILHPEIYSGTAIRVVDEYQKGPFRFTHVPLTHQEIGNDKYTISGHIHPGIKLQGKGRQSLILPCFYFGEQQAILPAFGKFTGTFLLKDKSATIFAILKDKVVPLKTVWGKMS